MVDVDNEDAAKEKIEIEGKGKTNNKTSAVREKTAAGVLVDAELNFENLSAGERRKLLEKWILNTEFGGFALEMKELYLAAVAKLDLEPKDSPLETKWGLTTADAERCLTDVVRTEKFRLALKETIKEGDVMVEANVGTGDTVVEAGAGTGILAMMAAAMGARKVYAVEINPKTVAASKVFLEYCGFGNDIIEVIETDATSCDLPEQVDVILSENMYTGLFAEPQMQIINNLRRFLKPGGKIVPERFSSYLELVESPDLSKDNVVRNEAGIPLNTKTTKAQFDVVNFGSEEEINRQGRVIIRANSDATVEAINFSSVIDLTSHTRIDSNSCEFLGQDELVRLEVPITIKDGELYQVNIDYVAGCRPKDIKISIEPAKKLRLDVAVSETVKIEEDKKRTEIAGSLKNIESEMAGINPDDIPPNEEKLKKILEQIEAVARELRKVKVAGFLELFELSDFYDKLENLFSQFTQFPLDSIEGVQDRLAEVGQILELAKKQREIEGVFNDTIESIYELNSADEDINLEKIKQEAPACAVKIMKCAEVLFDYKIGGTFRIDEFYTFVEKLQTYHAALQKLIIGQNIEVSQEYKDLVLNLQNQLQKHIENLGDVPGFLAGKIESAMSFEEYNELSIKMTDLYVQYLRGREKDPQAMINKENRDDLNQYVSCQEATAQNGNRFMIEFRGRKGCEFGRCSNCCFATDNATDHRVKSSHISKQFEAALHDSSLIVEKGVDGKPLWAGGKKDLYKFDILTPGSFLNDREMPKSARTEIFKKIAALPFTLIMFESRIEYLDEKEIVRLKNLLRPDQRLQVAIGLETSDNIIREVVINKGYTLSEFEKAVEMLAVNGIDVQAYSIIKPALLSEKQAQKDSVRTGQYLADLADKIRQKTGKEDFELTFKLEQAFIQDGGFLDYLHKRGKYDTPWTFTTAEIVRELCEQGFDKKLNIQIGTSHDYPPPTTSAQNRKSDGTYCSSTEALDKALQEFNVDNDGLKFESTIRKIQGQYPETFVVWQNQS